MIDLPRIEQDDTPQFDVWVTARTYPIRINDGSVHASSFVDGCKEINHAKVTTVHVTAGNTLIVEWPGSRVVYAPGAWLYYRQEHVGTRK